MAFKCARIVPVKIDLFFLERVDTARFVVRVSYYYLRIIPAPELGIF